MTRATPGPAAAALRAIAHALDTLTELLASALAVKARELEAFAHPPQPERMLVRNLGPEHLGRWIYLPGRPDRTKQESLENPEIAAQAGRLVGMLPGSVVPAVRVGTVAHDAYGTRQLVILRGKAELLEVPLRDAVDVAPREWS